MPRISQYSTEVPGSTSRLVGNVGSTTVGFDAGQLIGAIYTSQGQITYAASSKNSTFLNPPSSNAILSYSSGSSAPAWIIGSSGQLFTVSSAGVTTVLAAPTSGAVMVYSTANSSIGPRWEIPTSGALLTASSVAVPTWLAAGTSGQFLKTSTANNTQPAWISDRWGVSVQFNSAAAGDHLRFRVPFDCFIDEWDMNLSTGLTTATGSATVEVRVNGASSTPATSANQISSGALPTISNAGFAGSSAISSWTSTSLTEDTFVTLFLATVSSANTVGFSLGGRKR